MKVRRLLDKQQILPLLESDRLYAAYAIGDLADGMFELCEWAVAENGRGACALAMIYNGLHTPVLFVMGAGVGIEALLSRAFRLPRAILTLRPEHSAAVSRLYRSSGMRSMWRMSVDRVTFHPAQAPARRLHAADIEELNTLYFWGGADYFTTAQLERGVYYACESDGHLVAAAGTHVVAPEYGVAAVGNVYTHPDYRKRGLATACTGAVTAELLDMGCQSVVLNVWQDNQPALRAYGKLGFRVHCAFLEASGQRMSAIDQLLHRVVRPR